MAVPEIAALCARGVYTAPFVSVAGSLILLAIDSAGTLRGTREVSPPERLRATAELWEELADLDPVSPPGAAQA